MSENAIPLQPEVDYLYCPFCNKHVPCVRSDLGWEVQCPHCVGECGFCHCPLREACLAVSRQITRSQIPANAEIPPCPFPPSEHE